MVTDVEGMVKDFLWESAAKVVGSLGSSSSKSWLLVKSWDRKKS